MSVDKAVEVTATMVVGAAMGVGVLLALVDMWVLGVNAAGATLLVVAVVGLAVWSWWLRRL